MKFQELFHSNVLVLPDGSEETKQRGIVIPAAANQQTQPTGTVVMVGPGTEEVPVTVKKGERVMYGQGVDLSLGDKKYHLVDMRAIVGTVDPR